jgi:hypothetical protein
MTPKGDPEQQQAELLWKYIEELKQAENPDEVQFVAVTSGECAEVVGLIETASEAYAAARAESAPNCRREAVRRRLREAIASAPLPAPQPPPRAAERSVRLPAWLTAPLTGRSTGWVVAVAALAALIWIVAPWSPERSHPETVTALSHQETLDVMPQLVAGTLDDEKMLAALEHLKHCKRCLDLYEAQLRAAHSAPHRTGSIPFGFGDGSKEHVAFIARGETPGLRLPRAARGSRE